MDNEKINWRDGVLNHHPELACLGLAMRRIALEKNIPLSRICDRTGVSRPSVYAAAKSGWYRHTPSLDMFVAFADGLGVTPETLFEYMRQEYSRICDEEEVKE